MLGNRSPTESTIACVRLAAICADHQQCRGREATFESPWQPDLWTDETLAHYLNLHAQASRWALARSAACQYGMRFPGHEEVALLGGEVVRTYDQFGACMENDVGG